MWRDRTLTWVARAQHDRLTIEKRIAAGGAVKTSDISHLLELFQSALLKYWEVSQVLLS